MKYPWAVPGQAVKCLRNNWTSRNTGSEVSFLEVGQVFTIKSITPLGEKLFLDLHGVVEDVAFSANAFRPIYPDKLASDTAMFRELLNVKSKEMAG